MHQTLLHTSQLSPRSDPLIMTIIHVASISMTFINIYYSVHTTLRLLPLLNSCSDWLTLRGLTLRSFSKEHEWVHQPRWDNCNWWTSRCINPHHLPSYMANTNWHSLPMNLLKQRSSQHTEIQASFPPIARYSEFRPPIARSTPLAQNVPRIVLYPNATDTSTVNSCATLLSLLNS